MTPFVVFSLPRSRSTWLSVFLASPDRPVSHDLGIESDTPQAFAAGVRASGGTCETGAAFAWPLLRELLPEARFAVVRRDPGEVAARLWKLGYGDVREEIARRAADLDRIAAHPLVLSVRYADLDDELVCADLYQHCTRQAVPPGWWEKLRHARIEVDLAWQQRRLVGRAPQIAALKAEVARRMEANLCPA